MNTTPIQEVETPDNQLSVFPNPSTSEVTIPMELSELSAISLVVYDISGKQLEQQQLGYFPYGNASQVINIEDYLPGSYLLEVRVNG